MAVELAESTIAAGLGEGAGGYGRIFAGKRRLLSEDFCGIVGQFEFEKCVFMLYRDKKRFLFYQNSVLVA